MALLKPKDNPGVIAFPPLIWLVGALISGAVHLIWPTRIMNSRVHFPLGLTLVAMALSLLCAAIVVMRRAGTNINPSQPTLALVRAGPYRFIRNPMYLALLLLQGGLGFLSNDWCVLLFVVPLALVLHYGVILREERYLEGKFGEPYLALKRATRRWL